MDKIQVALAAGQHAREGTGLVADAEQVEQIPGPGFGRLPAARAASCPAVRQSSG